MDLEKRQTKNSNLLQFHHPFQISLLLMFLKQYLTFLQPFINQIPINLLIILLSKTQISISLKMLKSQNQRIKPKMTQNFLRTQCDSLKSRPQITSKLTINTENETKNEKCL